MPGYVLRDWEVVDYACYRLEGTDVWLRGPRPSLLPGQYFTTVGAAQTFGCFCDRPYPTRVAERLDMEVLNLGFSGAGPSFFLRRPALIEHINRGAFCVLQVMSGRSTGNSLLDNREGLAYGIRRSDGRVATSEEVFEEALEEAQARMPLLTDRLKRALLRRSGLPLPSVLRVVRESRAAWLREYRALMQAITVPVVLFWFSKRTPSYVPRYHHRAALLGSFPHLVNAAMIRQAKRWAYQYVECVTERGSPQPLVSRFTGEPVTVDLARDLKPVAGASDAHASLYRGTWQTNSYYPSPEMHADAADALVAVCRALHLARHAQAA